MKQFLIACAVAGLMSSSAVFAAMDAAKTVTLKGYVIDNACATDNKDKLAEFSKTHPKTCLMQAECMKAGYSLYSEGKLKKFTQDSLSQIKDFFTKDDSTTAVEVTAEENNGELKLVSIKNQ